MNKELKSFYTELKQLLNKHGLIMETYNDYDGEGRYCGQDFTLRNKEAVNGRFPIYVNSLISFVDNGSD